jgi:serine/threonine protein kinase
MHVTVLNWDGEPRADLPAASLPYAARALPHTSARAHHTHARTRAHDACLQTHPRAHRYAAPELYLSPERTILQHLKCDVWSLGMVFAEMLTGKAAALDTAPPLQPSPSALPVLLSLLRLPCPLPRRPPFCLPAANAMLHAASVGRSALQRRMLHSALTLRRCAAELRVVRVQGTCWLG